LVQYLGFSSAHSRSRPFIIPLEHLGLRFDDFLCHRHIEIASHLKVLPAFSSFLRSKVLVIGQSLLLLGRHPHFLAVEEQLLLVSVNFGSRRLSNPVDQIVEQFTIGYN
jgi:hypothetical protein